MFEPTNSHDHDDRCCCPVCSGLCQDDYEYYSGTGQYATINITTRVRVKNALYRTIYLPLVNWIAEHSFGRIKHHWF